MSKLDRDERILGFGLVLAIIAAGVLSSGCGSTGLSVSMLDIELLDFGGREQVTMARGDAEALMEAGGSTVPLENIANPVIPVSKYSVPGGVTQPPGPTSPGPGNPPAADPADPSPPDPGHGDVTWDGGDPAGDQVFLWKSAFDTNPDNPVIEHGTGVALLPAVVPTPTAGSLEWEGGSLAASSITRTGANGNRAHVRFGAEYPAGPATLAVTLPEGDGLRIPIPDAHSRHQEAIPSGTGPEAGE